MEPSDQFRRDHRRKAWIAVDRGCRVLARIEHADYGEALGIARTAFPEYQDGEVMVVLRYKASRIWRTEADTTVLLTPESCAKHGLMGSGLLCPLMLLGLLVVTVLALAGYTGGQPSLTLPRADQSRQQPLQESCGEYDES